MKRRLESIRTGGGRAYSPVSGSATTTLTGDSSTRSYQHSIPAAESLMAHTFLS